MKDIDDYFTDVNEVVCPHCGKDQHLESGEPGYYTEDAIISRCNECNKTYTIYGSMNWSWSTGANSDE